MWVIPSTISVSAPVSEGSTLDCEAWSKVAAQSLTWRSKHSQSRTWLRRWKRDTWIQLLCSRTCTTSRGKTSLASWIFSLEGSRVNRSATQGSVTAWKIRDTFGRPSQEASTLFDQDVSSSRMLTASHQPSHPDITAFSTMSSATWKEWVTRQRQAASLHRKSAHPTCASGGSSSAWPTPTGIHADRGNHDEPVENYQQRVKDYEEGRSKGKPGKSLGVAVNWPTASARDWKDTPGMSTTRQDRPGEARAADQLPRAVYREETGDGFSSHQSARGSQMKRGAHVDLTTASADVPVQLKMDGNTSKMDTRCGQSENSTGLRDQENSSTTGSLQGLLNPAWVETLMGFPSGWTDFVRLATQLCQQSQREHSQPSGES